MKRSFYIKKDGQTVILVIMVTAVLFTLIAALGTTAYHKHNNIVREEKFVQALYAAEAGIETTIARIKKNISWYNNLPEAGKNITVFPETELKDNITYEVMALKQRQDIGTSLVINSVGKCTGDNGDLLAKKTLESVVAVYNAEDYFKGFIILPEKPGIFNPHGKMNVDANLFMDGDVNLGGTLKVNGSIYASGEITGRHDGQKRSNYNYIPPFPELDTAYYLQKALEDGHVFLTDKTFETSHPPGGEMSEVARAAAGYNGFYYVDGDITVSGDYCGTALFFCTGDINVVGDLEPKYYVGEHVDVGAGSLTLVALGDVNINNHTVYANILADGQLRARGGAVLHGAVCTRGIILDEGEQSTGDFAMCYEEDLMPMAGAVPVKTKTVLWKELYPVF